MSVPALMSRTSFVELNARERARALLDVGSFRELLGPFDRIESPWLARQNIVPQADDGVVVARGTIGGVAAVVIAIEGAFQGGSTGEVSGAKIAGALELAAKDAEAGKPIRPVLVFETGGVRLQEANLGLAAMADVHAAVVALRAHVPVVGVIAGMIGCFGGMGITAGLVSRLIVTKQARLGLNGPEVIEQNAGVEELDSRDRPLIWSLTGGEQRHAVGLADDLVADDADALADAVRAAFDRGAPAEHASERIAFWRARLDRLPAAPEGMALRKLWTGDRP
ncbi:malonate decarboxylase beta subunit [Methylopila capsulata]|uniref:Biotin-independent malonate decarboxylase subunit beta n=1 Tax=Methylopila capsulata TaxID=61654 RepID=A0A9W6IYK4_9HYPH|nr:biotin-independent malonate decarboxylase subunit beta [Methylopila capsulata]MBM7853147.1 malonate decarboxylase beta subunit [Methylopila capsulata]GLK57639.1 biotin-independent malonate decarboxylase subunit beta [Methylopila capsulata]